MKITTISPKSQEQNCLTRVDHFMKRFQLKHLLATAHILKMKGISPFTLFQSIFILPFLKQEFFRNLIQSATKGTSFGKDAIYDFLKNPHFNWRKLMNSSSAAIISSFFDPLTSDPDERVLIIDDSPYERLRSKSVELLARVFDHVEHKFIRGFRLLQLGWSDGRSFVPFDFALLSSPKKSNRYQDITKELDKRTCGYKRRLEAITKSTELIVPLVKRALQHVQARYILMDSWFGFPVLIDALAQHLQVICRVKRMPTIRYSYKKRSLDLAELYRTIPKRRGKARIKGSVVVSLGTGRKVKIVFVKTGCGTDQWIALLTTQTNLPDDEIIRIYGKRWDIEVFFKMAKQYLRLTGEIQFRDFDGIIGYTTIVMHRYLFLAVEQREELDERSIGELFYHCCEEMADISFVEALHRILTLAMMRIRELRTMADDVIKEIIQTVMGVALSGLNIQLQANSES